MRKERAGAGHVPKLRTGRTFFLSILLAAFLFLILFAPPASAITMNLTQRGAQLAEFAADMPAAISITNSSLDETTVRYIVSIDVTNNGAQDWDIHLISHQADGWTYERLLGVVQPGTSGRFTQTFWAKYSGETKASTQYAVVAEGDVVFHGRYFNLAEDWSAYEQKSRAELTSMAAVFIPVFGGVIILLLILLAEWAYSSHSDGRYRDEYTVRSFFVPRVAGRPLAEALAGVLAHPLVWLVELGALALMASIIWTGLSAHLAPEKAMPTFLLSLLGAAIMPLVYFILAWAYNEWMEKMPLRFMAGMFIWGIMAAVLALVLNTWQVQALAPLLGRDTMVVAIVTVALIAPLIEELVKGAGLLALRGHHEFADALHGLHLGFAVGLGFSLVENWFYLASKTDPFQNGLTVWVGLGVYRSVVNAVAHGCFSAALGASLGWAKSQKWGRFALLAFLPGLVMAVVLHSLFNLTAIADSFRVLSADFPSFGFNPLMTLALLVVVAILSAGAASDFRRRKAAGRGAQISRLAQERL